ARPGEPGVEVRRRERWVLEVVEQPERFFEQERAEHRLVGLLDLAEAGELGDRLLLGALEQRPAGVLESLAVLVCQRSWAFQSSRRTWSTARLPRRTTWKGSKQISAWGARSRIAFS